MKGDTRSLDPKPQTLNPKPCSIMGLTKGDTRSLDYGSKEGAPGKLRVLEALWD